jgi:phosphatidylserine/phosphatidylglycerophosphate/cardiolipin synthase-like enzyme
MAGETPEPLAGLLDLPEQTLHALADAFEAGPLKNGISTHAMASFVGKRSSEFAPLFHEMVSTGCTPAVLGRICRTLAVANARIDAAEKDFFLTLSGPEVTGTPVVDTATVVLGLFNEAVSDVILTSYVFSHAKDLIAPLAAKHDTDNTFRVRIITDLSHQRKQSDEPLPVVANRFRKQFLEQHWAGQRAPELWHDPRVFKPEPDTKPGVMHAKVVIIDNAAALITSANFTEAAQSRNIEAGVLLRQPRQVRRIRGFFEGLIEEKRLALISAP